MSNKMQHKPVIETLINTAAIALTTSGVAFVILENDGFILFGKGVFMILLGAALEYFKYYGRQKNLW